MSYEDQILDPFINDGDEETETPDADIDAPKGDDDETEEFSDADL
jgi:hypothetical protein